MPWGKKFRKEKGLMALPKSAKREINAHRKKLEKEKKRIETWIKRALPKVDSKLYFDTHFKISSRTARDLVQLAVIADAKVDGAIKANSMLVEMYGVEKAPQYDVEEIYQQQELSLRVDTWRYFLQHSTFAPKTRRMLFQRYIARALPKIDNISTISQNVGKNDPKQQFKGKNKSTRPVAPISAIAPKTNLTARSNMRPISPIG